MVWRDSKFQTEKNHVLCLLWNVLLLVFGVETLHYDLNIITERNDIVCSEFNVRNKLLFSYTEFYRRTNLFPTHLQLFDY